MVRSAHIFPLAECDARLGHAYVDFADESQAEVKLSPLAEPGNWLGVGWAGELIYPLVMTNIAMV